MNPIKNRYDFLYFFDVTNGNPNGDPDEGNAPRQDPVSQLGFVSDVCLKRKIRNFITEFQQKPDGTPEQGYDIYVRERAILNNQHQLAYDALGLPAKEKDSKKANENRDQARKWMCQTFFDIRMFGAVMTTGVNCGQVRGPVQFSFANSISPITPLDQTITRMAVTTEEESNKQDGSNRTMGGKYIIPYALYKAHGFVNARLGQQTGFSEEDLELLWKSLENMFDTDRSAARGMMAPRPLLAFRHDGTSSDPDQRAKESALGCASAHQLFERCKVQKVEEGSVPTGFSDYKFTFDDQPLDDFIKPGEEKDLGNGITLIRRI